MLHRFSSQRRKTSVHEGKELVGLPALPYLCYLARSNVAWQSTCSSPVSGAGHEHQSSVNGIFCSAGSGRQVAQGTKVYRESGRLREQNDDKIAIKEDVIATDEADALQRLRTADAPGLFRYCLLSCVSNQICNADWLDVPCWHAMNSEVCAGWAEHSFNASPLWWYNCIHSHAGW